MIVDCRNNGDCLKCKHNLVYYNDQMDRISFKKRELDKDKIYNYKDLNGNQDRSKPNYIYYLETHEYLLSCCEINKK